MNKEVAQHPDKQLIKQRFRKASNSYDQHALAQRQIHQHLFYLLNTYSPQLYFDQILELGCGTGLLTQLLSQQIQARHWYLNDLCDMQQSLSQKLTINNWTFLEGDMERISLPSSCDVIISSSTFQWIHNKKAFLHSCAHSLNTSGLFLFNTFTDDNLHEIRQLTGQGLHYPTTGQWLTWLNQEFEILFYDTYSIKILFDHPMAVLKHLKKTGVTALQKTTWQRKKLREFCHHYQEMYTNNDKVELTYTPLFFVAKKK